MIARIYSLIITSILAFALIETGYFQIFENVLAQEGALTPEGSVNDTLSGQNTSQWTTTATLVFAQDNHTGMNQVQEDGGRDTGQTTEDMLGGDTGMTDGTANTTGGMTDGKSGESGTGNGGH